MCLSFSLKTERNFWPTLWYQEVSRKEYLKEYFPGFGNAQIIFISWQNYVSLWPASFCTPRPNLPVIPGISWLPTFAFQSPVMKRTSFFGHNKHLTTTQEKTLHMNIIKWSIPKSDWLYSFKPKVEKHYTVSKKRLEDDCGSDH